MKALITGITGQDGSYLAELLLSKGYEVHGMIRNTASLNRRYIDQWRSRVNFHHGNLESESSITKIVRFVRPDEVYHLAGVSTVQYDAYATMQQNVNGTHYLLEAVKEYCAEAKFYFAGSSEQFGPNPSSYPQDEDTPFDPLSPYAISKVAGHHLCAMYRDLYGLRTRCGLQYNHESPRRGLEFVTRKITNGIWRIKNNLQSAISLGNLQSRRDWGFAGDYARAMWMICQDEIDQDYIIATGTQHFLQTFIEIAFEFAGLDWKKHIVVDPNLQRKNDLSRMCGDARRLEDLGWRPVVRFEELVEMMVRAENGEL